MSAPPRRARGGGQSRRRAGIQTFPKSRGRGRGEDVASNPKAETLLQGLQAGSLNKQNGAMRRSSLGRAAPHRNSNSRLNGSSSPPPFASSKHSIPSQRDYINDMTTKFQSLKTKREAERAKAIRDGFLADPEKKTSLDKAITPVGTCTEMCPEFERVERIVQNMVDKTEKVADEDTGRDIPSEERMIKRFRRSAAGYDEQLPSDIRTPMTLHITLDYLLDNVVGGEERLATIHKFVWDRTRGIRNDFSIQQVTKEEDVRIAVDCFERIARFHILSLHQLSNPENLVGEHFDAHQEREQLNNTLLSLMYYYDDYRGRQNFPNEAEFRAYCIIFELQSQQPDLEDRMQSWPQELLKHPRISTAIDLYSAAGNTLYDQGPLKPQAAFDIAQGNAAGFWKLLNSKRVTYLMACVAEIYFGQVRCMALQGLWKSIKRAPTSMQSKLQDWTLEELTELLGFDYEEQALEFCKEYDLGFQINDAGEQYLDFTSQPEMTLDKSSTPNKQVFSFAIVEGKRYHRTLVAVINSVGVAQAIREGLVVEPQESEDDDVDDESALFIPETNKNHLKSHQDNPFLKLNPKAPAFAPATSNTQALRSQSVSSAQTSSNGIESNTAAAPFFPTINSGSAAMTGIFGDTASSKNAFELKTPTVPSTSSIFTFDKETKPAPASFFGAPSFDSSAPSASTPPVAPAAMNNVWPTADVNGIVSTKRPGDDPDLVPILELVSGTPKEPHPMPLADKTNVNPNTVSSEASSPNKPPSSPRPGFRTLSSNTQTTPLFPESPQLDSQAFMRTPVHESNRAAQASSPMSPQTPNSARELFTASFIQPAMTGTSRAADEFKSNKAAQDSCTSNIPQLSPLISKAQTTKQPIGAKATNVPSITTTKSAIPPTFIPNASPSFTTSSNTKPKHKSPLGSQPPIFATDAGSKPPPAQQSAADLSKATHNLAALSFLEPHGILQQYVEHTATALIEDALRQFAREEPLRAAQSARQQHLSMKYFRRWKSICWRRILNRNAQSRREQLAKSIRKASQRKARGDAELEAILEAQKEKERIQAEQLRRGREGFNPQAPVTGSRQGQQKNTQAGHKRKSLHDNELSPAPDINAPRKIAKGAGHRRSQTMNGVGSMPLANSSTQVTSSPSSTRLSSSAFSGRSIFLDRNSSTSLQRSTSGYKKDMTHTDYFRLKALGVDPETPVFPDTKHSLEGKRRRQEELSSLTPRKRASTFSSVRTRTSGQDENFSAVSSRDGENSAACESSMPGFYRSQPEGAKMPISGDDDDDDFLRQIREVRAALSEDTEWFRMQAAQIEKEVEHEKLKRSTSQRSSTNSTGVVPLHTSNGLSRVNGYEYSPSTSRSGAQLSLSRTEQRIRATGAHGLATKTVSDYLPVAMSKSTRAALMSDKVPGRSNKRKVKSKHSVKDGTYIYESDEDDEYYEYAGDPVAEVEEGGVERSRGKREYHKPATASNHAPEAHKEEADSDDEQEQGAAALHHAAVRQHEQFGFDEDLYDEEEVEGEEEEEEEAEEAEEAEEIEEQEEEAEEAEEDEQEAVEEQAEEVYESNEVAEEQYEEDIEADDDEDQADDEADDSALYEQDSEAESTASASRKMVGEEEEEGDDDGGSSAPARKANPFHMRLRSSTPESRLRPDQASTPGGTQMSRATSGTGVSVDDALVLSD